MHVTQLDFLNDMYKCVFFLYIQKSREEPKKQNLFIYMKTGRTQIILVRYMLYQIKALLVCLQQSIRSLNHAVLSLFPDVMVAFFFVVSAMHLFLTTPAKYFAISVRKSAAQWILMYLRNVVDGLWGSKISNCSIGQNAMPSHWIAGKMPILFLPMEKPGPRKKFCKNQ